MSLFWVFNQNDGIDCRNLTTILDFVMCTHSYRKVVRAWHLHNSARTSFVVKKCSSIGPIFASKSDSLKKKSTFNTAGSVNFSARYAEQSHRCFCQVLSEENYPVFPRFSVKSAILRSEKIIFSCLMIRS